MSENPPKVVANARDRDICVQHAAVSAGHVIALARADETLVPPLIGICSPRDCDLPRIDFSRLRWNGDTDGALGY